jgi:bifunctional non-homologous end joining protein LigD
VLQDNVLFNVASTGAGGRSCDLAQPYTWDPAIAGEEKQDRVASEKRGDVSESQVVQIQGKRLTLTNLEKVLYPKAGFTKGLVIDYCARIAPVLVPHLAGRPLTLKRYPNGVDEEFFFEKNATKHRPDWVKTAPIWSEGNRRNVNYILANDLPTLIWVANLAGIELHPSLSLAKDISCPR